MRIRGHRTILGLWPSLLGCCEISQRLPSQKRSREHPALHIWPKRFRMVPSKRETRSPSRSRMCGSHWTKSYLGTWCKCWHLKKTTKQKNVCVRTVWPLPGITDITVDMPMDVLLLVTFVITVFAIRALSTFKAARGHTVYDPLSGTRFTVLAAVREWHLEDNRQKGCMRKKNCNVQCTVHQSVYTRVL